MAQDRWRQSMTSDTLISEHRQSYLTAWQQGLPLPNLFLEWGIASEGNSRASPHFSQAFYCGTTMPRVACVALDMGAQRTAKYASAPKPSRALSPRTLVVPRYESCEKCGLVGEKTFANDRGVNAERWDSAQSTKAG